MSEEDTRYYSEIIQIDGQKYLVHSMYADLEQKDESLVMHQPLDQLLESQTEIIQNTVLEE